MNDPIHLPVTSAPALVKDRPTVRVIDDIRAITTSERALWMSRRKALLEELCAVETFLEMPRTRMSNRDLRGLTDQIADVAIREVTYAVDINTSGRDHLRERLRKVVYNELEK